MLEGDKIDGSKDKKLRSVTIKKKGSGKFVEHKAITHVSNMFAALDDGKNDDNLERSRGQMDRSRGFDETKHKLDQFLLNQVCFNDPIRKSGRPKRDIHKPIRYK